MRITIQVTCDSNEEAQKAIMRLTRNDTWVDQVESDTDKLVRTGVHSNRPTDDRLNKIMGSSAAGTEQSGSDDGATDAPRPNKNPGPSAIGKIGSATKEDILELLRQNQPVHPKFKEHLKLLWSRNEIKFDGKEYYI